MGQTVMDISAFDWSQPFVCHHYDRQTSFLKVTFTDDGIPSEPFYVKVPEGIAKYLINIGKQEAEAKFIAEDLDRDDAQHGIY